MDVSVLIPTYRRTSRLAACVASLARQRAGCRFEVIVGLDGPDEESRDATQIAWRESGGSSRASTARELRIIDCPRSGYTIVRNRLIADARGGIMLSLNDDVVADPGLINAHWQEHQQRRAANRGPAIVVGDAPYATRGGEGMNESSEHSPDSMLDRLVRDTSMVFFYDVMNTPEGRADRDKDWGFRHCFGLNFSADVGLVREVGGFLALPHVYGYDDIELGWKLAARFNTPVLYRPEARVVHHHFYTAASLMERERALGRAAWAFAGANSDFAKAVFGRDVRSGEELEYSRQFVARERSAADRLRRTLGDLERLPSSAVAPGNTPILQALYEQHLLLKRWEWRSGLLEASAN